MNPSSRWVNLSHKCLTAVGCIAVLTACVLVFLPLKSNVVELSGEAIRFVEQDVLGIHRVEEKAPAYTKDLSLIELKHMVAAGSPALRASAVQALGERNEHEVLAILVPLLNDTDLAEIGSHRKTVSELAKSSLTRVVRTRIEKEPGNIAILIPYFSGALGGTSLQRRSMIEILGAIREPLARSILLKIAREDKDVGLRESAERSLENIDSQAIESSIYRVLRVNQIRLVVAAGFIVCVLLPFMLHRFRKSQDRRSALLLLVPILICCGFAILIAIEHSRGRVNADALDTAIHEERSMVVRTMGYHDETDFPGDSFVARRMVTIGNARMVKALNEVCSIEPDDFDTVKQMASARREWVLARVLASKLGTSGLSDLVKDSDPQVRLAVTKGLSGLRVTNHDVVSALELLAKDEDNEIREKAAEALLRSQNYPAWPISGS